MQLANTTVASGHSISRMSPSTYCISVIACRGVRTWCVFDVAFVYYVCAIRCAGTASSSVQIRPHAVCYVRCVDAISDLVAALPVLVSPVTSNQRREGDRDTEMMARFSVHGSGLHTHSL